MKCEGSAFPSLKCSFFAGTIFKSSRGGVPALGLPLPTRERVPRFRGVDRYGGGDMDSHVKELTRLRGIGPVLSRRLIEAGLDSFDAILKGGEERLTAVRGLNPRWIPSILSQAAAMKSGAEGDREQALLEMRNRIDSLAVTVQDLAACVKDLRGSEGAGAVGAKVEAEIFRVLALLDRLRASMGRKMKRTGKGLGRAAKNLASLEGAGAAEIRKGLKKSRKSLERIFA